MKISLREYSTRASGLISEFKTSVLTAVDPRDFHTRSKLPFKAASIRELCFYRITDIAETALELFNRNKVISGIILTRAITETVAIYYLLYTKMEKVIRNEAVGDIDDFMMRVLFGCKDGSRPVEALNVLTAIDKLGKRVEHFREVFNALCEYSHPNWEGMQLSYGTVDRKKHIMHLSLDTQKRVKGSGLPALVGCLEFFKIYYNDMSDIFPHFIRICDDDLRK